MLRFTTQNSIKRSFFKHRLNRNGRLNVYPLLNNVNALSMGKKSPLDNDEKHQSKIVQNSFTRSIKTGLDSIIDSIVNPRQTWHTIKEVAAHYWLGSKLLWSDIIVAKQILGRVIAGHSMSRRERIQLIRTTTDIFRLVPFSIFVIVPFMELLLPFALKLFPNMLPSTFHDNLKKEETMKQELQMRLAVAKFMQETLQEMAEKKSSSSNNGNDSAKAKEVVEFVEKARLGEHIPNETVVRIARLFKDELTLSNVTRPQLVSMCQYMQLQPYGVDSFLRFQLRNKLRLIQEDDRRILWEGIDSLNTLELREACRDRGMRSIGITQFRLKKQLQEWLDLSTQKQVPISLLIISRAFMLNASSKTDDVSAPEQVLKSSMSFLDSDTINEVVLNAASGGEVDTADMRRRRLESIQFQKEMIAEERQEQEGAKAAVKSASDTTISSSSSSNVPTQILVDGLNNSIIGKDITNNVVDKSTSVKAKKGGSDIKSKGGESLELVKETGNNHISKEEIVGDRLVNITKQQQQSLSADTNTSTSNSSSESKSSSKEKQELTVNELVAISDLARGSSLKREISELAVLEAYIESLPLSADDTIIAASTPAVLTTTTNSETNQSIESDCATTTTQRVTMSTKSLPSTSSKIESQSTAASAHLSPAVVAGASSSSQQPIIVAAKSVVSTEEDKNVVRMKSAISSMVNKLKIKIDSTEKALGDKLKLLDKDGDGEITSDEIKDVIEKVMKRGSSTEDNVEQLFHLLDSNKDGKVSVVELLQYIQKKRESMEIEDLQAQVSATVSVNNNNHKNNKTNSSSVSVANTTNTKTTSNQ